jgi:hypothetical protein
MTSHGVDAPATQQRRNEMTNETESATHELEIWVGYNEDGDCFTGSDEDDVAERFDEEIGGYQRRIFMIKAKVPALTMPELEIELPAETEPKVSL